MSITTSLSNALTGLTASSRAAELVSNNVANAMTEGYGRREIALGSRSAGGAGAGVRVAAVNRAVDEAVLRDRRLADAALGERQTFSAALDRLGRLFGMPDDPASVTGRLAAFESSLVEAASRPDSTVRLQNALDAASGVAGTLNRISAGIQSERMAGDAEIARQVGSLGTTLVRIDELNDTIVRLGGSGRDLTALLDQRQQAVDLISEIVPLRVMPRQGGAVALYTAGGVALLDGSPAEISFAAVGVITPDMTMASGALSGIEINGRAVRTDGSFAPLGGGSLAAAFDVRDRIGPQVQSRIDALAREVIARFQESAVDPTLTPGGAGLFTDRGLAFDPSDEEGLASRISTNPVAEPALGGDLWKLRAGLGATDPGPVGDSALLIRMADAAADSRPPASAAVATANLSLSGLASEIQSLVLRDGFEAESELGYASTRQAGLIALERRGGVDTDQEMQKLLLIEQTYAANARVIQTIDTLIARLLEI